MQNIIRYDGDNDNIDVNSEDSSSQESPEKETTSKKLQKPVHVDADDEVQVVSVTVATKKEPTYATIS